MKKRLDIKRLSKALHSVSLDIKEAKTILRSTHNDLSLVKATMSKLVFLKIRSTKLACLRAQHRGRHHISNTSNLIYWACRGCKMPFHLAEDRYWNAAAVQALLAESVRVEFEIEVPSGSEERKVIMAEIKQAIDASMKDTKPYQHRKVGWFYRLRTLFSRT